MGGGQSPLTFWGFKSILISWNLFQKNFPVQNISLYKNFFLTKISLTQYFLNRIFCGPKDWTQFDQKLFSDPKFIRLITFDLVLVWYISYTHTNKTIHRKSLLSSLGGGRPVNKPPPHPLVLNLKFLWPSSKSTD